MELPDKLVVFGQSCVGKTTFAKTLNRTYYCFDSYFPWHLIETCDLSISACLRAIGSVCTADRFVLDGWHLSDANGEFLPQEAVVIVLFASYEQIINQYRIPVVDEAEFAPMYERWYMFDYSRFPSAIYIENQGDFVPRSRDYFLSFVEAQVAALRAGSYRRQNP